MTIHAAHSSLHGDSGIESPADVKIAEDDLLRALRLDHTHDVPLVAGMSRDGKTIYVDRYAYPTIKRLGYLPPLIVHEGVEHLLMTILKLPYAPAHAIATGAEEQAARSRGIRLSTYNSDFNRIIVSVARRGRYPLMPDDLDPQPYKRAPAAQRAKLGGLLANQ